MMLEVIRGEADAAEWQRAVVGDALERGMALLGGRRQGPKVWRSVAITAAFVAAVVVAVVASKRRVG